jgi:hypothetical protein
MLITPLKGQRTVLFVAATRKHHKQPYAAADWPFIFFHGILFNFNKHTSQFFKHKVSGWCAQDPTVPARFGFM